MTRMTLRSHGMAFMGPLVGGGLLLGATALLIPNRSQIADAIRRATFVAPAPAVLPSPPTTAMLMQRFTEGKRLSASDLSRLLAASTATAKAAHLSEMADGIQRSGGAVATSQITYDILAGGRPEAALAFLESRPDAGAASLWRLRFELNRKLGNDERAADMLRAAALTPGTASSGDVVEAAYALGRPDMLVTAAESGAAPRLGRAEALNLASWANGVKRYDLIGRIDRAGTPTWRGDNPWLAMTLAQRAGDTASALRYAALLPSGRDAARESIVMASGDRDAMRRLLLEQAVAGKQDRGAVAQQLLEKGFRPDAISLLRQQSSGRAVDDVSASRMLYLMGPRPGAEDLSWLRSRATADIRWLPSYLEREHPARALAFLEARPDAAETDMLFQRIRLANAAHDEQGVSRALDRLLDGRPLDGPQLKLAGSALVSQSLARRYALSLSRARIRAGQESASDRMDLAWDAWNRGDLRAAVDQLGPYLQHSPNDRAALQLMASAQARLGGRESEGPWLRRLLALSPPVSRERAELLTKLGQTSDAIAMVEALRQQSPRDRQLDIQLARLLIAAGDPGRARKVLRP